MKGGGYYGLRGKQISLTLIALIGTTIFIWAWEKSPLLTTFLPPQNRILIPSPGTPAVDEKQDIILRKDISFGVPEGEITEQAETSSNVETSIDSATESIPEPGISLNKDISYAVPKGEARTDITEKSSSVVTSSGSHERIDEENKSSSATEKEDGEKITEQAEKRSDGVTPSGSDTKSIPEKSIDDGNEITFSIEKEDGEPRSEQAENSFNIRSPSGSSIKSTTETYIDDGDKQASSIEKEEGERTEQATKSPAVVTPVGSATGSTPETSINVGNKTASSIEKKDIEMVVPQNETNPKQDASEETRQDPSDKNSEAVTPVVSAIPSTSVEGKYSPQSEIKPKKDPEDEKGPNLAEKSSDVVPPVSAANQTTSEEEKDDNSAAVVKKKEACNYAKGEWVEDSTRPLYSGSGCKQWLSEMWACRLTQRTDFSYERFRWKPFNCEMPDFERSSFLRRMQDKTIAIVGDSLGRQQFQSLMCMVTGGEERSDVINVGWEYGLVKARGAIRPDGWAYRFPSTNTTILYYWSASLCDLEPMNPTDRATDWAMHLDRPPAFLRRYLHRFDVLVLNTGHHWNRGKLNANRWVMHVGGVPNTDRKLAEIGHAKNFTVYSIVNWVNLQLPKHPQLKAFFRTISPRHFFHGDWNTGGSCDNTTPLAGGKEVTQDKSLDTSASRAVMGTGVKLLDITALSQLRDEGHISRYSIRATPGMQDCLHWCLPGIPDTWNELFIAQL